MKYTKDMMEKHLRHYYVSFTFSFTKIQLTLITEGGRVHCCICTEFIHDETFVQARYMLSEDKLRAAALEYVAWDPCPETQATISELLHSNDYPGLTSLLGKRQSFGTAGLRGPMCAGYAGLNYLVVLQTTQGLIRYLQNVLGKETAASQVEENSSYHDTTI